MIDKDLKTSKTLNFEIRCFYHTTKGNLYRYIIDTHVGDEKLEFQAEARESYQLAVNEAYNLDSTNPVKLILALNYSVYLYDCENTISQAIKTARLSYESALHEIENLDEKKYQETALIIQLIRDNLKIWEYDAAEESSTDSSSD